jgi:hypothetical protein
MQGQINLGTNLGDHIYRLAQRPDIQTIVEIGTWNGLGSTLCVLEAIKDSSKEFISIEAYKEMCLTAERNLRQFQKSYGGRFKLLNGTIITPEDLKWIDIQRITEEVKQGIAPNEIHVEHFKIWLQRDIETIACADNILHLMPKNIDMLILDGGEYSTYPEWLKLKDRTRIFVLDDTRLLKCKRIRQEMLDSNKYKVIVDNISERNGYTILEIANV